MEIDGAIQGWTEELTSSLAPGAPCPPTDIMFTCRGNVRAEVEKAPRGPDVWWRARVAGSAHWHVPRSLPWSYGVTEATAVDAALALWMSAGQPGLPVAGAEPRSPASVPETRLAIAAGSSQANATIVTAGAGATVEEHQVRETVERAVRVLASALDRGASTLALVDEAGSGVRVAISSIIELRGPEPEDQRTRSSRSLGVV